MSSRIVAEYRRMRPIADEFLRVASGFGHAVLSILRDAGGRARRWAASKGALVWSSDRVRRLTVSAHLGASDDASGSLRGLMGGFRKVLLAVAVMSGAINILYLTGSFFMLQVYDRVIPSRSIPTLVALALLVLTLYLFQAALELIRMRVLVRMAGSIDADLTGPVYRVVVRLPLRQATLGDGQQPLRDLDTVKTFMMGAGLPALFDLPWIPIYLGICFFFHPLIGAAVLVGALVLGALAVATELNTRELVKRMAFFGARRSALAEASRRNAEAVQAMGMTVGLARLWRNLNDTYHREQQRASDVSAGFGSVSKLFRMALQSAVLAVGAFLVIEGQATGGIIIASSILAARALAPVELAIANWRGFVAARQGAARLDGVLEAMQEPAVPLRLPRPTESLQLEGVCVAAPGGAKLIVADATFELLAGQGVGIVGPSGSGKSCLSRAIVGAWLPVRGTIRLDGAALTQWTTAERGRHVGYLPQDVELFDGTVADNIARFAEVIDDAEVIAAARAAGVHDLILRLPDGYATKIGEGGAALSAGQRQRIGLARALFGDPFLVVLDEPNSNLDQDGELALAEAVRGVRRRGGIVVVVAHRAAALAAVDLVLAMANGRITAFGSKDEMLQRVLRPPTPALSLVGHRGAGRA